MNNKLTADTDETFILLRATEDSKRVAENVIASFTDKAVNDDTWRHITQIAQTCVDDICATMTLTGVPVHLVAMYRLAFEVGYARRLDDAYGKPQPAIYNRVTA